MANEQINVPSLVVILVLSGLIIRYLFFSSPAVAQQQQQQQQQQQRQQRQQRQQQQREAQSQVTMRTRETAVERIQQMFPQVDRRTILWDLQRTRGSIAATTERILLGQLETPPITFQPPPPPGNPAGNNGSMANSASGAASADKPAQPDLITRYHLQDRIAQSGQGQDAAGADGGGGGGPAGWSSNRDERQSLLQQRRNQMILEARRKMEAKIAAEKAAAAGKS